MSRARRLRTPDGERWSWAAISVEIKAGDEPHREQRAVVRLEAGQDTGEVHQADAIGRIRIRGGIQGRADVHHNVAPPAADGLAGLVGGDRDQPCPDLPVVPQGREPAPRDGPRSLDGIARHLRVAADRVRDLGHRRVVADDEPLEGNGITACRKGDGRVDCPWIGDREVAHER